MTYGGTRTEGQQFSGALYCGAQVGVGRRQGPAVAIQGKGIDGEAFCFEGPAVVFRFLSYDLEKIERNRYNMEKGTVTRLTPR